MHPCNLPFFRSRPDFLARIANAPDAYRIELSKSGAPVPVRASDGKWLGSRYDPAREAARWLESQPISRGDLPVLFGLSPAHLRIISARPLLVVERDASLVKAVLEEIDLGGVLDGVTIILDDDGFRMMSAIRNAQDPFRHLRVRILASPYADDEKWIRRLASSALDIQREMSLNALSYAHHFPIWMQTVRSNLEAWASSPDASGIMNALAGETAVVVAAGPSLDRNVADLALVKGKAIIIAVDTALRKLDAAGIVPDIAVAVDANHANSLDVVGLSPEARSAMLFVDHIASPEIIEAFTGPKAFLRTVNYTYDIEDKPVRMVTPLDRLLAEIAGREDLFSWQSGGSVSTNAFSLAHILGAGRVIMVGQDLAYTDGRSHARGVGYEDDAARGISRFLGREMVNRVFTANGDVLVDAWDGGKARTSTVLREYLHWYEMTMERGYGRTFSEVIDATEGGARKKGMMPMRLRDAAKLLGSVTDPAGKIRGILERAGPIVRPGWRERTRAIADRAGVLAKTPERIADELPMARWIALPAYIGGADLPEEQRDALVLAALRSSAEFLAKVWS